MAERVNILPTEAIVIPAEQSESGDVAKRLSPGRTAASRAGRTPGP
jgi:hypothetical protein